MESAKLFINGRNQAVRIPKAYEFPGDKVYLKKVGKGLLLLPDDDPWQVFEQAVGEFPGDYMAGGRDQGEFEERESV